MKTIPNISDGLWEDLKTILEYLVIKNKSLADSLDTLEYQHAATLYFSAIHKKGAITLYAGYYTFDFLAPIMFLEPSQFINDCVMDPIKIPAKYHNSILSKVYPIVISNFIEKNDYYRTLMGLPPFGTPPSDFIFLKNSTYLDYSIKRITVVDDPNVGPVTRYPAIHEMSSLLQDVVSKSSDFQEILASRSDAEYLRFIGIHAIELEQARNAYEFEIIRLFPNVDPNINQDLVVHFANEYNKVRNWITKVMWNADLEQTSIAYRQYVGFAILIKALRLTLNRQFDGIIENSFLNDKLVTVLFDLYRIPQSLNNLPRENRRRLALEMRKLIRDRAGNKVLYDVARILGFDNIVISKVVLNKIQLFDETTGEAIHNQIKNVIDPTDESVHTVDDPYHSFRRQTQAIDLKSKNPHDDIIRQTHAKHYVREVTEPDPRWWEDNDQANDSGLYPNTADGFLMNDLDEIKKREFNPNMFKTPIFGNPDKATASTENTDMSKIPKDPTAEDYDELYWNTDPKVRQHPSWYLPGYNSVDTKYLMLTYHYSMAEKTFEMIYLMRFLLDKQTETETYRFMLPTYGGPNDHSIYDIVLFLVCGLNKLMFAPDGVMTAVDGKGNSSSVSYEKNKYGQIIQNDTGYHRILGFNLDLTDREINDYLDRCTYLDANLIKSFIGSTTLSKKSDIRSAWAVGIIGLRDYLISQMELASTIVHWREAEKFYNMMFTYDPVRDIHAKPGVPTNPDDEYVVPTIRYRIYDMEVSDFGNVSAKVGQLVRISLNASLTNITKSHTIICGIVGEVSITSNGITTTYDTAGASGKISRIDFKYRDPNYKMADIGKDYSDKKFIYEDYHMIPYWNRTGTGYNNIADVNLQSDFSFDIGDLYNPSGTNGPDIQPGSYRATINGTDSDLYVRVTASRFHTKNLYEYYLDELLERDEFLWGHIMGDYTDEQMAERLSEACDILSEAIDVDLNFMRSELAGGEDMEIYLMDMIRYIKSYTIDFITSEKKLVLNDKKNPEWLRMIDQIGFDPKKPTVLTGIDVLMIYDAVRHVESHLKVFDGKRLPKTEWDNDAFTKAPPHMTDSIKIYTDADRPGIRYYYRIVDIEIERFTLPEGIKQGTKLEDTFSVENHTGEPPTLVDVEIYIGYNPTPGQGQLAYYHDSGFMYNTIETVINDLPILICFHHNMLPISLQPDVTPIGGRIESSDNGYFIGKAVVDYVRNDINNPQYRHA